MTNTDPVADLFARIKQVEQRDGSWPGGDVVAVLCEWFAEQGYNVNASAEDEDD